MNNCCLACMLLIPANSNPAWSLESLASVKASDAPAVAFNPQQLAAAFGLPAGQYVLPEVRAG